MPRCRTRASGGGEIVKKGDLLFVIDPRPFEIARDAAEAQIAQARRGLIWRMPSSSGRASSAAAILRPRARSTSDGRRLAPPPPLSRPRAAVRSAELDLGSTRDSSPLAEVHPTDETTWKRQGILDFVDNSVDRSAGTIRARADVVFFGMLGVTGFGLIFTPIFYVVVRNLFGKRRGAAAVTPPQPERLETP